MVLSGCGLFAAEEEPAGPLSIRTPQPTFTPTVPPTPIPTDLTGATSDTDTPQSLAPDASQGEQPRAVVNTPLLNARSGPNTDAEVVAMIERGAEYTIVGISPDREWWQVCCIEDAEAWVAVEYIDTLGPVDSVPVIGGSSTSPSAPEIAGQETGAAPPAAAPVTPSPEPASSATFILENQEQFPETGVVRIFLYVYSGNSALEGYSLRVTKDGTEMPVEGSSFGGQPAFTWPFQDPRQRFQNFKVEYPDTSPQGTWQVQLIDSTGATVGPPATFTLSSNDPQQELYVRYAQQ